MGYTIAQLMSVSINILNNRDIDPNSRHLEYMCIFRCNKRKNVVVDGSLTGDVHSYIQTIRAFYLYKDKNLFCMNKS
jgi:uncharacterized protein YuzB (UPF0349 family)